MVDEILITFLNLVITLFVTLSVVTYLFRRKVFYGKYVDVKEAPLHINNALKDHMKRRIIRSLKREKKYLTLISKEIGESVAKTKYHLHELEKIGLIASMKLTREKFFLLTKKGQWCLNAIHHYYPMNNFERLIAKMRNPKLKWKEKK